MSARPARLMLALALSTLVLTGCGVEDKAPQPTPTISNDGNFPLHTPNPGKPIPEQYGGASICVEKDGHERVEDVRCDDGTEGVMWWYMLANESAPAIGSVPQQGTDTPEPGVVYQRGGVDPVGGILRPPTEVDATVSTEDAITPTPTKTKASKDS